MRIATMIAASMLTAATAGMAHGETEGRGPSPIIAVAEAAQAHKPSGAQRTLGICEPMENRPDDPLVGRITIAIADAAASYFSYFEKQTPFKGGGVTVTLPQPPAHGQLTGGKGAYSYRPDRGFHGQDKIVALVELSSCQVTVIYFIKVVKEDQSVGDDEASIKKYCGPRGTFWKISLPTNSPARNQTGQARIDSWLGES